MDGIIGEVMYPSVNMAAFSYPERDVVQAVFQRHNDWICDYTSHAPQRLVGIGCLPLPEVKPGYPGSSNGLPGWACSVGASIPCTAPLDKPYNHPDYEPFWCAAEEAGLPISMHIFCGSTPDMGLPAHWGGPGTGIVGLYDGARWDRGHARPAHLRGCRRPSPRSQICLC